MFRLGSFLMMIVLAAPMVRECCLPIVHAFPCHESKPTDDITCSASLQAIAETKAATGIRPSPVLVLPALYPVSLAFAVAELRTSARTDLNPSPPIDIYIRTGALLI
jgi:hypothetical protein